MSTRTATDADRQGTNPPSVGHSPQHLRIPVLGMSLGLFLAVSFVLCVALGLLFPAWGLHQPWLQFLPGFRWLTGPSFLLRLVESFAYGWYIALVFVPLYNMISARWR
jgi:hypothetical protein